MPTQMQALYTGRSGHLAVMAKFLHRGYNTAIPEVDRGDDIFVVKDLNGDLTRIQVKAANGKGVRRHYAQYKVPLEQLKRAHTPELYYVFAIHYRNDWRDFLVISRNELWNRRVTNGIGRINNQHVFFRLSFADANDEVLCHGVDLGYYRNRWAPWPVIQH